MSQYITTKTEQEQINKIITDCINHIEDCVVEYGELEHDFLEQKAKEMALYSYQHINNILYENYGALTLYYKSSVSNIKVKDDNISFDLKIALKQKNKGQLLYLENLGLCNFFVFGYIINLYNMLNNIKTEKKKTKKYKNKSFAEIL